MERIGNMIRAVVANAIQTRLHDPRLPLITSVTRVDVAEDLSVAKVHVSVMAPPARQALAVEALQNAAGVLRRLLGPELRISKIPHLLFKLDESVQRGLKTLAAIEGAMRELGEKPEWEREPDDAAEAGAPDETGGAAPGTADEVERTAPAGGAGPELGQHSSEEDR